MTTPNSLGHKRKRSNNWETKKMLFYLEDCEYIKQMFQ